MDGNGGRLRKPEELRVWESSLYAKLHFPPSNLSSGEYYERNLQIVCVFDQFYYQILTVRSGAQANWPFCLVAQVGSTTYSYRPRSDFCFLLDGCPCVFLEVISDPSRQRDRYRMLIQAGVLVRVMNSIPSQQPSQQPSFVAIAIYIDSALKATRYLVYQPDSKNPKVCIPNADLPCVHISFPDQLYPGHIRP
jgi:hypothetical protein